MLLRRGWVFANASCVGRNAVPFDSLGVVPDPGLNGSSGLSLGRVTGLAAPRGGGRGRGRCRPGWVAGVRPRYGQRQEGEGRVGS